MIKKSIIFILLYSTTFLFGQKSKQLPTADEVLANAVQAFNGVHDLIVNIDVEVQMERMQIPNMNAIMYFKKPNKLHFVSQGFLFLPKEGIIWNPSILQERYTSASFVIDTIDGITHYKLLLVAKDESIHLQRLSVWISSNNWTVRKIESSPYEGRTLTLEFFYLLVQNNFWLPEKSIATFASTVKSQGGSDFIDMKKQALDNAQLPSMRSGTLTIIYSGYKVNTGIDDSVFEQKKK